MELPSCLKHVSAAWPKHDPMISIDMMIVEKISAEARQPTVHHVDRANEWEVPHRYSS